MSEWSYKISKSSFLKFEQCPKAYFLYKKSPQLRDPISKEKQLTFKRGHDVGKLAQDLFPGGIDVSLETKNLEEASVLTKKLISEKHPVIYEATFVFNETLVMVDILNFNGKEWTAYEVKSSLKISDVYIKDSCLQYYVLKNSIGNLNDFYLVTLNGDYKFDGELKINELFKKRSVKSDAEKNISFFESKIDDALLTLEKNIVPNLPIGKHCFSPYTCDFFGTCWKNADQPKSIFNIGKTNREQLFEWYSSGIDTVYKIPNENKLQHFIQIQIESIKNDKEYCDIEKLKLFFDTVNKNHCFLDMEVWQPAIPKYNFTKPFEQIPFLYSLCFEENNETVFKNYLKPIKEDGREEFLKQLLLETKDFDSVIVYDKNLEVQILKSLKNMFPDSTLEIEILIGKMKDLADVIHNFYYFHPNFKGNFSLKKVADIVSPESNYNHQNISSGLIAMSVYESLLYEENPIIKETIYQQLIDYCNTDTLISLKFFNFLKEKIKE